MGFVGVREDSSDGAAAVILDMLLKFGVPIYNNDGSWKLHRFANLHQLFCFGDCKTIENGTFVDKLSNCSLPFKQSIMQAEIFLNAFNRVMFLPGDWHAGMNMLQSIVYKIFWEDLLKPFRDLLKWKRISNDVRDCYFWASRLVQYSNDVILSYPIWFFISHFHKNYDDRMNQDETANVLCSIAINFDEFLSRSLSSTEEHLTLIVNFLIVSSDFLAFVQAYQLQDSISVENGYKMFVPIWKILGQTKYLEAKWEQMDSLYSIFPILKIARDKDELPSQKLPGINWKGSCCSR